jgi:hypothetical protein
MRELTKVSIYLAGTKYFPLINLKAEGTVVSPTCLTRMKPVMMTFFFTSKLHDQTKVLNLHFDVPAIKYSPCFSLFRSIYLSASAERA